MSVREKNEEILVKPFSYDPKLYEGWRKYNLETDKRAKLIDTILSPLMTYSSGIILDNGCGEGGITFYFSRYKKMKICSIDIDISRIARARAHLMKKQNEKVEINFIISSGLSKPFRSDIFKLEICNDVIEHVPWPYQLLKETYRTLKMKGILYLTAPNKSSPHLFLKEGHFNLFGITLMPYWLAKIYVVKIRKVAPGFDVYNYFTYSYFSRTFSKLNFKYKSCYKEYYLNKDIDKKYKLIIEKPLLEGIISKILVPTHSFICIK